MSMPAAGHVYPTIPVVAELVRRGHRVSYVTGDRVADAVRSAGATLVPIHNKRPGQNKRPPRPPSDPSTIQGWGPELFAGIIESQVKGARASFSQVLARFQWDQPDAVCYDAGSITGRMLPRLLKVPDIMLVTNFASNERFSFFARVTLGLDMQHPELRQAMEHLCEFAAGYGLPPPPNPLSGMPPASLNVVFIPRQFQLAAGTFDDRFVFTGPSLGTREADGNWEPRSPGVPVLFISFGTDRGSNNRPGFYRMCLDAFADGKWQVAMAIGYGTDPSALGRVPGHFDVRPSFPQLSVLRYAGAFISHAGMNSVMEALYYGVPLVMMPQLLPEQDENARRAEELGVGRRLAAQSVSAQSLRSTVEEVYADAEIHANLGRLSALARDAGGAKGAADAIEAHVARRTPELPHAPGPMLPLPLCGSAPLVLGE